MSALKIGSRKFAERYQEKARDLMDTASGLSDRPTPDEIHDLRVTARRVQVMRRLLPRAIRVSDAFKASGLVLKTVMKRTSQLRDLDTLTSTLEEHRASLPGELFVALRNQRSDAAAHAKLACNLLTDSPPPAVDASEVRGKRLSRKLRKRARGHGRAAVKLLPGVLKDESRTDRLHSLRLEVKKLRYLLELSDRSPPEMDVVTRWQDSLGAVHDLDVALEFLQKGSLELKGWAIEELRRSRHQKYLDFVNEYAADSIQTLGRSAVLPGCPAPQLS